MEIGTSIDWWCLVALTLNILSMLTHAWYSYKERTAWKGLWEARDEYYDKLRAIDEKAVSELPEAIPIDDAIERIVSFRWDTKYASECISADDA